MLRKPPECAGCPLEERGLGFSRPDGMGLLGVMIVLEALGEHEAREGLPARPYAPAGARLERIFRSLGYNRSQFTIWNTVACRPPKNWLRGAPWEFGAIEHCKFHFDRVMQERKPRVLCALGDVALRTLTGLAGRHQGIGYLRGYVLPHIESDAMVIGSYHPSPANINSSSLYGVISHDISRAVQLARNLPWQRADVDYHMQVGRDEALSLQYWLRDNSSALLAYDIETPNSRKMPEDERDDDPSYELESIQFSNSSNTGWFFGPELFDVARDIMRLPNPKVGHNNWNYDDPRLRKNGFLIGGDRNDDTMWMWHHMQPDLPAHLQFVASFFDMDFPWKHLDQMNPQFYGCADVDACQRIMKKLPGDLQKRQIWNSHGGYEKHVRQLHPILVAASDRGVPVNNDARLRMRDTLTAVCDSVLQDIQKLIPAENVLKMEPKEGYAKIPPRVKELIYVKGTSPENVPNTIFTDPSGQQFRFVCHRVTKVNQASGLDYVPRESGRSGGSVDTGGYLALVPAVTHNVSEEPKWFREYLFNPNAWQQVLRYIKAKGHPIPKSAKKTDEEGNAKETTEKKELESLGRKTKDPFYELVIDFREHSKMKGTYVDGFAPAADGCVHTTFTNRPATGQLSSVNPNIQNIPKHQQDKPGRPSLAQAFRQMIQAQSCHRIVEFDFKAFHALTSGFEAQDALYMRMARHDIHSFFGAHVLKLPERDKLPEYDDAALDDFLGWVKKNHKHERDAKWKRCLLGYGFGQQYRTLYQQNRDAFTGEKETKALLELLDHIFSISTNWRERIREVAYDFNEGRWQCKDRSYPPPSKQVNFHQGFLLSRYNFIRWFHDVYHWDGKRGKVGPGDDYNEAVAFLPANDAFGHIKDCMITMQDLGILQQGGFCNQIHDSLVFHMHDKMCDTLLPQIKAIMTAPNPVLTDPVVAPNGLACGVSVSISSIEGNWGDKTESNPLGMEEIKV